ncbi:MAG TPA: T9SS type A sorting domain-containing protein, partial [Chitinophagales bacterium]|nr:T9SS type A sorting domain-containing protein [Chitinophagales bacterium]
FNFSNTSSQKNIKITLSNLPANYNLQLYEPSGVLKVSSKKANTLNEEIILNNYTVGKYKLKVFGANSAFNASQCYSLSATISSTPFRLAEEQEEVTVVSMNIFPNPTMGDLTVIYNSNSNALVDIYVVDVTGKVMLMQTNDALKGSNTYHFDLNRLNNGVYFLQIRNGNEISHTKLMIGR